MDRDIKNPCIKVCRYDGENICMGCYRTMDETTGWLLMNEDRKLNSLKDAEVRRRTPKPEKNDYDYYV